MNVRRTRLVTGLILLSYLSTHLLNHALGLISLDAMNDGRVWFLALWRNPAGTALLYTSLLTHFSLALWSLYQRRHLRIPLWEALQLTLGLSIPPLLSLHFVGTRMQHEWFGVDDSYSLLVLTLWHAQPWDGLKQATLITVAWLHGCIGFHFWLRLRPWYRRVAPIFLGCALLLPVLGLLGFTQAGHEVDSLVARNPDWIAQVVQQSNVPPRSQRESLYRLDDAIVATYVLAVILTLLARIARDIFERRSRIRIRYPGEREVQVPRGFSVLEASRFAGLPHASVCGGRGRCSTCRIRVTDGLSKQPLPSTAEQRVLQRVGAPPNVRLACQLRPVENLSVTPLVPANAHASDGYAQPSYLAGQERTIAVLFADLRTFTGYRRTKTAVRFGVPAEQLFRDGRREHRPRRRHGRQIHRRRCHGFVRHRSGAGGRLPASAGGGASAWSTRSKMLSQALAEELAEPLRIGVGIHCGPAVVGRMGYGATIHLTAIGDTVNVASRLQDLTKEFSCHLVISEEVAQQAGLNLSALPRHEITVRNRREALAIFVVDDVAALAIH